jgi:nucleotide-binding universal stress UspA family protein
MNKKSIISPVNFSANSHNAARYGADMAELIGADLHLLHILQVPIMNVDVPTTDYIMKDLYAVAEESLNELKQELVKRTFGKIQVSLTMEVGGVEQGIVEFCRLKEPFVVVMGATGNSMERNIVGSSVVAAIGHLRFPLILVPGNALFHSIKTILLACDLNDVASGVSIAFLKELQSVFGARLEVINIDTKRQEERDEDRAALGFHSLNEKIQELSSKVIIVRMKNVEDGINEYLSTHQVDLVLVFPKKHHLLEFHKSHAKKIAHQSLVPIMSIRA